MRRPLFVCEEIPFRQASELDGSEGQSAGIVVPHCMKKVANASATDAAYVSLLSNVVSLLEAARKTSAKAVNHIITATYWEVGRRIVEQEQRGSRRAEYGERLIRRLAEDLTNRFGRVSPEAICFRCGSSFSPTGRESRQYLGFLSLRDSPDCVWTIARRSAVSTLLVALCPLAFRENGGCARVL